MTRIYLPPTAVGELARGTRSIFLAGSIEMGTAADWQTQLVTELGDRDDLAVFNPRREEWDASWRQSIDEPKFREQVEWELDNLERAHVIAMWFAPTASGAKAISRSCARATRFPSVIGRRSSPRFALVS